MFTAKDKQQIESRGIAPAVVEYQLEMFRKGFPKLPINKACINGDGISKLSDEQVKKYTSLFESSLTQFEVVKFVPASGAATRMFKELFDFMNGVAKDKQKDAIIEDKKKDVKRFFDDLKDFAFYEEFRNLLSAKGFSIDDFLKSDDYISLLKYYLTHEGLSYGSLPKGLLQFHQYPNENRTAVEEHLIEGAEYCKGKSNVVKIHFTVSPEHQSDFEKHIAQVRSKYENKFGVSYQISYSQQSPSTDTIAVDMNNEPFREAEGNLLFRPGGHGALLENLNNLQADIIMIKNIDNITTDQFNTTTFLYKKVLAGVLLEIREHIFNYLKLLESDNCKDSHINEISDFIKNTLCTILPSSYNTMSADDKKKYLFNKLNRPIRVCGMVKNEGDTGGGPFWAKNSDGSISLQIAETSQIDLENESSKAIFKSATHFNPNDIALTTKDYKGYKFDLMKYRDPDTGFISKKSKDGRDLKAQELPGLWNGSMSDWVTVFVDVPLITFNPVKSVNDLLKKEHRNS